jgi:uncharacterized protein (DUF433 family)
MKEKADSVAKRVELGQFLVADVAVCGGQPTYKGTRIMAWIVLEQLERGLSWDQIAKEWGGKVTHAAIAETITLSHLIVKHQPFLGFHVGARREPAHQPAGVAA